MFIVEEYTLCDGWVNNWSADGSPSTFKTEMDAWAELETFFMDMHYEFEAGNIADEPSRDDFRIVEVA